MHKVGFVQPDDYRIFISFQLMNRHIISSSQRNYNSFSLCFFIMVSLRNAFSSACPVNNRRQRHVFSFQSHCCFSNTFFKDE